MDPNEYTGKDWDELLQAMNPRDIKRTLKAAYRRVGKMIADIARSDLASSGLRHGNKMKGNIRVYVYSRGGGFKVTVKPHGKQGYYKRSQDGKEKPIAMWAEEGTTERHLRHGNHVYPIGNGQYRTMKSDWTGSMRGYHFMIHANVMAEPIIDKNIQPEIEKAVYERLKKIGWK